MAHYIFNLVKRDSTEGPSPREQAAEFMRVRMWCVHANEPHCKALASGDLVLIYLGAPEREFIGRAVLASAVREWTPSEAHVNPGDSAGGVLLAQIEEWDPPVPMSTVLARIDPAENARADFEAGVVRITAGEYETALAVAAEGAPYRGRVKLSGAHGVRVLTAAPIIYEVAGGTTQHAPMVIAEVGGLETRLVLDTGSEVHLLTRELVDRIGLTVEPGEAGTDHAGAPTPSWSVGDLPIRVGGAGFTLRDVVAIPAPPPFEGWGIGGILSPQNLHLKDLAVIDLVDDQLLMVQGEHEAVAAWLVERAPALTTLSLEREDGPTVVVRAAVKPFPEIAAMLNTGGRHTEFASTSVPGLSGSASERLGGGVGGSDVLGSLAGAHILIVGDVEIPVEMLAVRDSMEFPHGIVGMDVLRGTVLVCGADPNRRVLWQIPSSRASRRSR
ncbi:MAG: retropepsin-like aspartic protease [Gaiellaceae bacterium]